MRLMIGSFILLFIQFLMLPFQTKHYHHHYRLFAMCTPKDKLQRIHVLCQYLLIHQSLILSFSLPFEKVSISVLILFPFLDLMIICHLPLLLLLPPLTLVTLPKTIPEALSHHPQAKIHNRLHSQTWWYYLWMENEKTAIVSDEKGIVYFRNNKHKKL